VDEEDEANSLNGIYMECRLISRTLEYYKLIPHIQRIPPPTQRFDVLDSLRSVSSGQSTTILFSPRLPLELFQAFRGV